jgi:glutamate/tyrosine decarboxylase-like PLP-dependent enzyme
MNKHKKNSPHINKSMDEKNAILQNNLNYLSPYFLGAYAENNEILERLLIEFVRDHMYWRRNYHPEDTPPITPQMMNDASYQDGIAKIRSELHSLTAKLKRSVPFYHPRYIGHMSSDLMMPALLAQLVTCFYNPNNLSHESAPVTLEMELAVGNQFADLFGFNTDTEVFPCAWGHLTSGGTSANYESLWNFRAAKFYPIAIVQALKTLNLTLDYSKEKSCLPLESYTPWELVNLSIDEVTRMMKYIPILIEQQYSQNELKNYQSEVEKHRIEFLGEVLFFSSNPTLKPPVVLVPITAHYSWKKAMRLLGLGTHSLIKVPLNSAMRMDENAFKKILSDLNQKKIPILGVIGVLGTTEYGTIDPIDDLVSIRNDYRQKGLHYSIHIDAAWGGYLTTLFRGKDGAFLSFKTLKKSFNYFPSKKIYHGFLALSHVDSITIDPHKQGYLPFGTGGFIARNRDIAGLLTCDADYVFSPSKALDFTQLGQYILEGSKPGSNAAAVYVAHSLLPLNNEAFGRIIRQTVCSSEYFFDQLHLLNHRLKGQVDIIVPFEPDSNLVTIVVNPSGNQLLSTLNEFSKRVYSQLSSDSKEPIQFKEFLGSKTYLSLSYLTPEAQEILLKRLHFPSKHLKTNQKLFILRHTLMNPWLSAQNNGCNYIDKYCLYLEKILLELL